MIQKILGMSEAAQTDLQTLIERAQGMTYKATTDADYESLSELISRDSYVQRPSMISEAIAQS